MADNFKPSPPIGKRKTSYVKGDDAWERYQKWVKIEYLTKDVIPVGLPPLDYSRFLLELDRYFKGLKSTKGMRYHIDKTNGYGDIENAVMVASGDIGFTITTVSYKLGE